MTSRFITFAIAAVASLWAAASNNLVDYVCPLVGTQSTYDLSAGNTYPAIAMPWGMNVWTPQTGPNGDGWQYSYTDRVIRGFKQTHQPSPWINDYGMFSLMPETGRLELSHLRRGSHFGHKAEKAEANYYKVYLADYDITAEMTPTERAAILRFTYPEAEDAFMVVDAFDGSGHIEADPTQRRVTGRSSKNSGGVSDNFANYFVIEFDRPFTVEENQDSVVGLRFEPTRRGDVVTARVASSFISPEQALVNLREVGDDSFDTVRERGRQAWQDVLGRVEIDTDGDRDLDRLFYTMLYRSVLFPRKFYEITAQGDTVHYSPHDGNVYPGPMYTDTGVWDTFRALFPLLNLLYPSVNREIQEGYLNHYRESGFYPEWASPGHRGCMVGNNTASVLADAYLSGVQVTDTATLWRGIVAATEGVHPTVNSSGRLGYEEYNRLGYVPCDTGIYESAARTLEYAYDDWAIWQLAKRLDRPAHEQELYARRALNYRNLFNPETRLMRGRRSDGTFDSPFSPFKWGDAFTEGNAWHYTWSVFHDPQGLIDLMGGRKAFTTMLDSVFTLPPVFDASYYGFVIHEIREMQIAGMGNYAHGNQPAQHIIYLYDWAGEPWKTQHYVRETLRRMYSPTPDGYCGDEDNGQTSAWYVFSSLGFYPVAPGTGQYALGAPLFRRALLHLENGRTVTINATRTNTPEASKPGNASSPDILPSDLPASDDARYVESLTVDGLPYDLNYLTRDMLLQGPTLNFTMSPLPNLNRGTSQESAPYSMTPPSGND